MEWILIGDIIIAIVERVNVCSVLVLEFVAMTIYYKDGSR